MALSSSDIGVSASNYVGNAQIGGGSFGAFEIDSRPIQQLAYYTYLYNRSEYDQKQKDVEAAAKEIADYTSYDLTSAIEKDAKILETKYDELVKYVQANPDALDYRNKKAWSEYKRKRNELENDLLGAKTRSTLKVIRDKEISDEKNEERKKLLKENLDKEISETGIRTPLQHTQKYDISVPEIPKANAVTFDVYRKGANQDFRRDYSLLDMRSLNAMSSAFELDLAADMVDATTEAGKQKIIARGENFWLKGSEIFNASIQSAKNAEGIIDETKLKGLSKEMVDLIKKSNQYLEIKRNEISSGAYTDKFGNSITFGTAGLREEDYQPINYQDGISPAELAKIAGIASWAGDTFKTAAIQTNDLLEQQRIATTRRGQDLDFKVAWKNAETARMNAAEKTGIGSAIQTPAILFGQHIDRVKNKIAQTGKEFIVPYSGTDKETRAAVGLEEGEKIRYNADGSFQIIDAQNKIIKVGTVEELKQGFIDAVKNGINEAGVQTEGFQNEAEKAFDGIWRTRSGKTIWDNWNKPAAEVAPATQPATSKEIKRSEISTKAARDGYSIKEYEKLLKQNGIKIID